MEPDNQKWKWSKGLDCSEMSKGISLAMNNYIVLSLCYDYEYNWLNSWEHQWTSSMQRLCLETESHLKRKKKKVKNTFQT